MGKKIFCFHGRGYKAIKAKGVIILSWRDGIELLEKFKVGNKNGSYFKRAPTGATQDRRVLWLRLLVLLYSQLEQKEQLLLHVMKNGGLNGGLDTLYTRDI